MFEPTSGTSKTNHLFRVKEKTRTNSCCASSCNLGHLWSSQDQTSESWAVKQMRATHASFTAVQRASPPINLTRSSSLTTANAPAANMGSREEGEKMQDSLQRNILRTRARHCCWVTAKNEESSASASPASASGSSELQQSCAIHAWSQSSNHTIVERREKLMRAEMRSDAVDSQVACPYTQPCSPRENLSVSWSAMDLAVSTPKNSALLQPRLSLKAKRSRRLAEAAPQQIIRCEHAGNDTLAVRDNTTRRR